MAGHKITFPDGGIAFVDYADATGSAEVNGRIWRWEFHERLGPTFLRADGEPRKCQNPGKDVWVAFEKWFKKYDKLKWHTVETETSKPKWLQSVGHENSGLEKCARCGGDGFIEREPGDQTSWVKCTRCYGYGVCPGRLNKKHYEN